MTHYPSARSQTQARPEPIPLFIRSRPQPQDHRCRLFGVYRCGFSSALRHHSTTDALGTLLMVALASGHAPLNRPPARSRRPPGAQPHVTASIVDAVAAVDRPLCLFLSITSDVETANGRYRSVAGLATSAAELPVEPERNSRSKRTPSSFVSAPRIAIAFSALHN